MKSEDTAALYKGLILSKFQFIINFINNRDLMRQNRKEWDQINAWSLLELSLVHTMKETWRPYSFLLTPTSHIFVTKFIFTSLTCSSRLPGNLHYSDQFVVRCWHKCTIYKACHDSTRAADSTPRIA